MSFGPDQGWLDQTFPGYSPSHFIAEGPGLLQISSDRGNSLIWRPLPRGLAGAVGFVSALDYWHPDKPRELWINEVGVTSNWQRRGIGTQLMQAMLDHARARDQRLDIGESEQPR